MKKMMIALVAMFVMTMSANAQSEKDSIVNLMSLEQLRNYLDLSYNQEKKVEIAIAQFQLANNYLNTLPESQKTMEGVNKMLDRQKRVMKKILTKKQYNLYVERLNEVVNYHIKHYTAENN